MFISLVVVFRTALLKLGIAAAICMSPTGHKHVEIKVMIFPTRLQLNLPLIYSGCGYNAMIATEQLASTTPYTTLQNHDTRVGGNNSHGSETACEQ